MPQLIASEVAQLTGGRLRGDDATASTVVADSREVVPGAAFVAVGGGHAFAGEAIRAGAPFVIVDRETDAEPSIIVDDTVRAVGRVAAAARERAAVPVVGVTGSTGKTLTKDLLAAALASRYRVHATPKSYNAELGVPLTLLQAPDDAEVYVVELAARHRGEIAELCEIARPVAGLITGIGISHIEEFGSREAIASTKAELIESLPADGVAVLPSNDDFLDLLSSSTRARVVTVGPGGSVRFRADRVTSGGSTIGTVWVRGIDLRIELPVAGRALMRNAAQAIAVATELGVDPSDAADALRTARLSAWRMEIAEIGPRGSGQGPVWTVVNDAYNANPTSVAASLRAVRELAGDREVWAVLGRMAELGQATEAEHRRAGRLAAELGYAGVIVVGDEAAGIAAGVEEASPETTGDRALRVGSLADAVDAIRQRVAPGAVIVVKASRAAGLERLVDELTSSADAGSEAGSEKV